MIGNNPKLFKKIKSFASKTSSISKQLLDDLDGIEGAIQHKLKAAEMNIALIEACNFKECGWYGEYKKKNQIRIITQQCIYLPGDKEEYKFYIYQFFQNTIVSLFSALDILGLLIYHCYDMGNRTKFTRGRISESSAYLHNISKQFSINSVQNVIVNQLSKVVSDKNGWYQALKDIRNYPMHRNLSGIFKVEERYKGDPARNFDPANAKVKWKIIFPHPFFDKLISGDKQLKKYSRSIFHVTRTFIDEIYNLLLQQFASKKKFPLIK